MITLDITPCRCVASKGARHQQLPGRWSRWGGGQSRVCGNQGCGVPATSSSRGAGAAGAIGRKRGPGKAKASRKAWTSQCLRQGGASGVLGARHQKLPGCWSRWGGGAKVGPFDCLPFSHALMAALKLTTSGVSNWCTISCSNPRAHSHCLPFSHALMAALKLTTSGDGNLCTISCNNPRAPSHCSPF